jgi:hypothetical protein
MSVFVSVNDQSIIEAVKTAQRRLVYAAPGVSEVVANAIVATLTRSNPPTIAVILDGTEEACRLGHGDVRGLEKLYQALANADVPIHRQAGLRLGVVVSDERILIWSPIAESFDAPRVKGEPNGLVVDSQSTAAIPAALGIAAPGQAAQPREIGTQKLPKEELQAVVEAIKQTPVTPFNLARLTQVFSTKFQFVETELRGAELIGREIRLDSLLLNADAPEELRGAMRTTVRPFAADAAQAIEVQVMVDGELAFDSHKQPIRKAVTQRGLHQYWHDIEGRFLIPLPGFGRLVRQAERGSFAASVDAFQTVLRDWVTQFHKGVEDRNDQRREELTSVIVQRLKGSAEQAKYPREVVRERVAAALERMRVIEPKVRVVYKNISWQSKEDEEFRQALAKALPPVERQQKWFEEFAAARAVDVRRHP